MSDGNKFDDFFNDNDVEEAKETASETEQVTSTEEATTDEEVHNGVTNEELQHAFGNVDDSFILCGEAPIESITYGVKYDDDDNKRENPLTDKSHIIVKFKIKSEFGDMADANMNFYHDDENEDKNANTNLKIKYAFAQYGIKSFEDLTKFAEAGEEKAKAILNKIMSTGDKESFLVKIYQRSGKRTYQDRNGDEQEQNFIYYSPINRIRKFSNYSEHWKEQGGFPGYPTMVDKMQAMKNKATTGKETIKCKLMSVNNDTRFNRFVLEVKPVDVIDEDYKKHLDEVYDFICTYPYDDGNKGINYDRRNRQAASINGALGTTRFADWQDKIGSIVEVAVSEYNSSQNSGEKVYRARLK